MFGSGGTATVTMIVGGMITPSASAQGGLTAAHGGTVAQLRDESNGTTVA